MDDSLFLRACRRESVERTPVWLMRQAGRYMSEYRAVRAKVDFLTLCRTPDLVTEVTLQPIDRFGFDAAILFSDIFIPVAAMGVDVKFAPGPTIVEPLSDRRAVEALRVPDPAERLGFVATAIGQLRAELEPRGVPLIGFGGAPFTLACYLVEGKGARHFTAFRKLAYEDPETARLLLDRLTDTMIVALRAQVAAGAQAIQLFDTWAGLLGPTDYDEWARPWVERIFTSLADLGVPRIYFASGAGHLTARLGTLDVEVVSVDWRIGLDQARGLVGDKAVQGNLDPVTLLGPWEVAERRINEVLDRAGDAPGHVFNLGHGILPPTPVDNVDRLVALVRERTTRTEVGR